MHPLVIVGLGALAWLLLQRGGASGSSGTAGGAQRNVTSDDDVDMLAGAPTTGRPRLAVQASAPGSSPSVHNPNVAGPVNAPAVNLTSSGTVVSAGGGPPAVPTLANDTRTQQVILDNYGRISETRETRPGGITTVAIYDHVPMAPGAGYVSVAQAQAQAGAAYQSAFGQPISAAQLDALSSAASAAGLPVVNGMIPQDALTSFLNSPAALAAVQ